MVFRAAFTMTITEATKLEHNINPNLLIELNTNSTDNNVLFSLLDLSKLSESHGKAPGEGWGFFGT